jgi:hypothetical protein
MILLRQYWRGACAGNGTTPDNGNKRWRIGPLMRAIDGEPLNLVHRMLNN